MMCTLIDLHICLKELVVILSAIYVPLSKFLTRSRSNQITHIYFLNSNSLRTHPVIFSSNHLLYHRTHSNPF